MVVNKEHLTDKGKHEIKLTKSSMNRHYSPENIVINHFKQFKCYFFNLYDK